MADDWFSRPASVEVSDEQIRRACHLAGWSPPEERAQHRKRERHLSIVPSPPTATEVFVPKGDATRRRPMPVVVAEPQTFRNPEVPSSLDGLTYEDIHKDVVDIAIALLEERGLLSPVMHERRFTIVPPPLPPPKPERMLGGFCSPPFYVPPSPPRLYIVPQTDDRSADPTFATEVEATFVADASAPPRKRGFAALTKEQVSAISKKGGHAAHASGTAHKFSSDEARNAGRKGGNAPHVRRGRGPLIEQQPPADADLNLEG